MYKRKSTLLMVIFWLSAIGCFIFGYYNAVLGLQTFEAFGSNVGSWFLALIPLVMVFGGYLASVQGKKGMLALYLLGEVLFFIFNLTYLYPHYLGRTLVNEEAKALKDTLSTYQNFFDKVVIQGDDKLNRLKEIQSNLLDEIALRNGFGPEARGQLEKFNELAGAVYTPSRYKGNTPDEQNKLYNEWKKKTDDAIYNYIIMLNSNNKSAEKLIASKHEIDYIIKEYTPLLEIILSDNSDVIVEHEEVANNPQIGLMKELAVKLDKIAIDVNSACKPEPFKLITGYKTVQFPKTQKLGTFEHTMVSVYERLNKLDTWGVIIICLFFDMLGPFLFYFYLRKDEDEEDDYDPGDEGWPDGLLWWKRIFGID